MRRIGATLLICLLCSNINILSYGEIASKTKIETALKNRKTQLEEKKKEISELEEKISTFDEQIIAYTKKLEESREKLKAHKQNFKTIMVRIYKKRYDSNLIAQLATSRSLSQFLNRLQIIGIIIKEEKNSLDKYIKAKSEVEESIHNIQQAKDKQKPLLEVANKEVSSIEKDLRDLFTKLQAIHQQAEPKYYNRSYGNGAFCFPSPGGRLTNNYMERRGGYFHKGVDIPNRLGAPIVAADSGVVILTKSNPRGYGYYIDIRHKNGLVTRYAHMWRSTVTVKVGQHVKKGQVIARVGLNGDTSGPHLHFEVHKHGGVISPMPFL